MVLKDSVDLMMIFFLYLIRFFYVHWKTKYAELFANEYGREAIRYYDLRPRKNLHIRNTKRYEISLSAVCTRCHSHCDAIKVSSVSYITRIIVRAYLKYSSRAYSIAARRRRRGARAIVTKPFNHVATPSNS